MLQATAARATQLGDTAPPMVICNEAHRFLVAEQLRAENLPCSEIVLEPIGRNTAPAAAVAALLAVDRDPEAVLLIMPADHLIQDIPGLQKSVAQALPFAARGMLVTFGIQPTKPETGYGYIMQGAALDIDNSGRGIHVIERFVEKPDLETATGYVKSGNYLWNSGMFLMKAETYLAELEQFLPQAVECCREALAKAEKDLDFLRLDEASFAQCPAESVDYAVMEKTRAAAVAPLHTKWSDVGAWSALAETGRSDDQGNVCRGDVLTHESKNNYLYSTHRLVATVGIENLIVVETKDAVLVTTMEKSQEVKKIVDKLTAMQREEPLLHRQVYRPWGSYEGIDSGDRFQVKRIIVKPGQILSLQMHHHRAEHWIIVKGTAKVTNGKKTFLLSEDESTYIPLGTIHRLENPGKIPLELIEVQTGSYVGEDDIERFEDVYGRTES
jgi:mannose-1-phosphate guanylyltransferase/mannose-6-phosphate isomerase